MKAEYSNRPASRPSHVNPQQPVAAKAARRHAPVMRALHWAVAGLIIAALVMSAFVMPGIRHDSPEKIDALRRHMSVGLIVLLLTFVRMAARRRTERPGFLSSGMAWADRLARSVHRIFDLLILAMIASGIGMAALGGVFPAVFGLTGALPAGFDSSLLHLVHRGIGITIFALLALHVGGAFYHQFILRDGLIGRMGLGLARR